MGVKLTHEDGEIMNIKYLREKKNFKQEDLATMMNIDRSSVAKWETGESLPRTDKLLKLASILGCTVDDLLSETIKEDTT